MLHQAQASKSIYGLELGPVYDPALILIVFEHQAPATANGTGRAGVILYLGPIAVVLGLQLVPVCGGAFGPVVRGETTGLIEYGYHHGCTETAVGICNGILCGKLGDLTPHLVKDLTALVPLGTGRSDGHGLHTLASQHRPQSAPAQRMVFLQHGCSESHFGLSGWAGADWGRCWEASV